jgi:hypothetical protein
LNQLKVTIGEYDEFFENHSTVWFLNDNCLILFVILISSSTIFIIKFFITWKKDF